jgi:hypothetical protein
MVVQVCIILLVHYCIKSNYISPNINIVYDWDIVYLGMKIIFDELVNLDSGINKARKVIKVCLL